MADRAGFSGAFTDDVAMRLDQAFPLMMKQLELMLTSGELNPRQTPFPIFDLRNK
ncbi:hypothetical protein AA206_13155 [Salmonella enterica subsp. enterica serovar Newport]|nr:hypothetical protein [Salmonella enterica subsp. enterica serovar Newport]